MENQFLALKSHIYYTLFSLMNALVYVNIDQGIHKGKNKNYSSWSCASLLYSFHKKTNMKNIRQIYCALTHTCLKDVLYHWISNDKNVLQTSKNTYFFLHCSLILHISFIIIQKNIFLLYHPPYYYYYFLVLLLSPE